MNLGAGPLNSENRRSSIRALKESTLDVLIVGGGITGAGAALDAAARGFHVGLIEQSDFGSGTSSKSSKMIHGGLRYLEQFNIGLVREGLHERSVLLERVAPHLVKPIPFLYPLRRRIWERLYVGLGVLLYDWLGGGQKLPSHRHLTREQTAKLITGVDPRNYIGGIQFWDAQEDDARYTIFVIRTAVDQGASVASRVRADDLVLENGCVSGVVAVDEENGERFIISARHVVIATGPSNNLVQKSAIPPPFNMRPSKGVHIVLPRTAIPMETGLIAKTNRGLLFVIPWDGLWLVGDTDNEWQGDESKVTASASDIMELLARLNSILRITVTPNQVIGVYAGIRPLVARASKKNTTELSRKHLVGSPAPGLTIISGGKYTTYRRMAKDVIDEVAKCLLPGKVPQSQTENLSLVGATGYGELLTSVERISSFENLSAETVRRLIDRYGDCFNAIVGIIRERPDLRQPLGPGISVIKAEVVYACVAEGALHIDDVLERRTRISIQTRDRGCCVVEEVARLMGESLGWTDDVINAEISAYRERSRQELAGLMECMREAGRP